MKPSTIAEALERADVLIDPRERIDLFNDFAFHQARNHPLDGLKGLDIAKGIALDIGDHDLYAKCLGTEAICLETLARYDEALDLIEEAQAWYRKGPNINGLARTGNTKGVLLRSSGRTPESILTFNDVIGMTRGTEYRHHFAAACNNLGAAYFSLSRYDEAIPFYIDALRVYEEDGNERNVATLLENIGSIYYHIDEFDRSLEYMERATAIIRRLNDRYGIAHLLMNMSALYKVKGESEAARRGLEEARDIFVDIGERKLEGVTRVKLGLLYEVEGEREDTLQELERGTEILREVNALTDYVDAKVRMARLHLLRNEPAAALAILDQEEELGRDVGNDIVLQNMAEVRAESLERLGRLQEALEATRMAAEIRVKLMGEERQRIIAEMQARYAVEHAEREREVFRVRADDLEKLAEERSKQLSVMAMQLVQKNNLLKEIDDQLDLLQSDDRMNGSEESGLSKKRSSSPLEPIRTLIGENLRSEEDWKRFEEVYNLVHNDFSEQLALHYPDLSPMELKICALLRINLSNKEIADILYVSVRTVESHRYRIRKKLGLSGSDNLSAFLSSGSFSSSEG